MLDVIQIAVWGWGRVQQEIARFPEAIGAFHPDASPFTDLLIEQNNQIKDLVKQQTLSYAQLMIARGRIPPCANSTSNR